MHLLDWWYRMYFRNNIHKLVLIISAACIAQLALASQLTLYIHPRYILLTIILTCICLVVLIAHSFMHPAADQTHSHRRGFMSVISFIPLCLVLCAALILPARPLTSSTVTQRSISSNGISSPAVSNQTNAIFSGSTKNYKLADWAQLIETNTDPSYYENKPVRISGFIYDADLGTDTVWLARFVLTCCAVDARPVGIPVKIENWSDAYSEDDWIDVSGTIAFHSTAKGEQLVVIPESVSSIEEPENPYAN